MGIWAVTGLFPGVLGRKWGYYTCFLQLDLISALYMAYVRVIYGAFMGILPFTGILQVIYGTAIVY